MTYSHFMRTLKKETSDRRKIRRIAIQLEQDGLIDGWTEDEKSIYINGFRFWFDKYNEVRKVENLRPQEGKHV